MSKIFITTLMLATVFTVSANARGFGGHVGGMGHGHGGHIAPPIGVPPPVKVPPIGIPPVRIAPPIGHPPIAGGIVTPGIPRR